MRSEEEMNQMTEFFLSISFLPFLLTSLSLVVVHIFYLPVSLEHTQNSPPHLHHTAKIGLQFLALQYVCYYVHVLSQHLT